jgi:hypothetical protein
MSDDPFSKDSIFVSWGEFRAGAVGRFAIVAFVVLIVALVVARSRGWL